MLKVYGIHSVTPKPGLKVEEFEQYMARLATEISKWPGVKAAAACGDRGAHIGAYLLYFEFDSAETRDRFFPANGVRSLETQQLIAPVASILAEWGQYAELSPGDPTAYTDYVAIR